MTNIQSFIEDAIKGGWKPEATYGSQPIKESNINAHLTILSYFSRAYFLDPSAWQAVSKTRGWDNNSATDIEEKWWYHEMHRFLDNLISGDDIETALSKLT